MSFQSASVNGPLVYDVLTVCNRLIVQIGPDFPPVHPHTNREAESGSWDYPKIILEHVGIYMFVGTQFLFPVVVLTFPLDKASHTQ